MVGGETVMFDIDMNCSTKKNEAVRIKLAPLGANLKNSKVSKTPSRKRNPGKPPLKPAEKKLLPIKCPPTIFSAEKFSKIGMFGTVMSLPTKNRDGVIKFYTDRTYSRAEFSLSKNAKSQFCIGAFVQFDLHVWFNPVYPFEAGDIKIANKTAVLGHYSSENFICDGLTNRKPWSLLDFRQLMTILRDCGCSKAYDWKMISQLMKKSQQDVRSFLCVFISHHKKTVDPQSVKDSYGKRDLDKFIKSLIIPNHNGAESVNLDIGNILLPIDRQSSTDGKENHTLAQKKSSAKGSSRVVSKSNKRSKTGSPESQISAVDSLANLESSGNVQRTEVPANFTPHHRFVAKNLLSWRQIPEIAGEHSVNSVLGDVMSACAEHVTKEPTSSSPDNPLPLASSPGQPDYGKLYNYMGSLLGSEQPNTSLPNLTEKEAQIMLYLVQDLFEDISKRTLHTHKQFLLQRFFDFTGNKSAGRTPINPYKLKGFLLHLPDPRKNPE